MHVFPDFGNTEHAQKVPGRFSLPRKNGLCTTLYVIMRVASVRVGMSGWHQVFLVLYTLTSLKVYECVHTLARGVQDAITWGCRALYNKTAGLQTSIT